MNWTKPKIEKRIRETGYPGTITHNTGLHALALLMRRTVDPQADQFVRRDSSDAVFTAPNMAALLQAAIGHDLGHVDFLHQDAINCTLMSVACELAHLEGHTAEPDNDEDFVRSLMRSTVPPAVVLQWIGLHLGVAIPTEITDAVRRLRADRQAGDV